jgi:AcrR family transcriptional regulator
MANVDLTGPRAGVGAETGSRDPVDGGIERATVQIDGRHARSERSRTAMVDALLDLLKEGNLKPSATQIADRAGVTQRTLFNHFGDMDSIIQAAAGRQTERVLKMLPDAGDGSFEERVTSYCSGLATLLEETMNVRWAVVTTDNATTSSVRAVQAAREFMRAHLAEAFAPELDTVDHADRALVLDAIEIQLDPAAWRLRRQQQGLSFEDCRAVLERSIASLLR